MNYVRQRKAIEKLYEDKATISRFQDFETDWGETRNNIVPIYTDQTCRLSQRTLPSNGQSDTINSILYETKVFIAPELEIKQGDTIEVLHNGLIKTYTAGEPFTYPTHQEISLQRNEKA
ncbi:ABC transporter ATP-binding protein [Bacillus sp. FJAT-49736]|uniref:ABC transporter ATP-binding protein n=1 Tax=Bacillus sp. FJAT-49736 TaxID=2833582 RepID=UPI001BC8E6FD|nr:ABC transporter ATP-binding protein [Bacillus sp. FJAT-49736]MBS4172119.1 ABC transporter ATP-binding protein [Bacillus sp. FJAT-49736]